MDYTQKKPRLTQKAQNKTAEKPRSHYLRQKRAKFSVSKTFSSFSKVQISVSEVQISVSKVQAKGRIYSSHHRNGYKTRKNTRDNYRKPFFVVVETHNWCVCFAIANVETQDFASLPCVKRKYCDKY